MHVGILAACLPTLKPLFASFFGQIRTFTKGTPFKSSGYTKHDDGPDMNSFPLNNLNAGTQSHPRNMYNEDDMFGKETYIAGGVNTRRHSRAGDSDESILSHGKRGSDGLARGMGIVRTTEVSVTR
jgi:hypothetical protein